LDGVSLYLVAALVYKIDAIRDRLTKYATLGVMPHKKNLTTTSVEISVQLIEDRIYLIRGQKVMIDFDLAELYGVATSRLNEQVRRNRKRFPDDFMFQLTKEETDSLRSQIAISKMGRGGRRYLPKAFTEQGVAMLSTVLNSERAIEVNIAIMRVFVRLRRMLETNEELNRKFAAVIRKLSTHDKYFKVVFNELKKLTEKPVSSRRQIGFKGRE
jgi:hypothetical protein